jgi:hypothetical protein
MPATMNVCHCRMCQKAVGGPYAALVSNQRVNFAWTRGMPATFRSSSLAERDFCRACGTPLAYRGPSGNVNITYGSLDQPHRILPKGQFGVEGRVEWIDHLNELPGMRTEDDLTTGQKRIFFNFQHPDHETPEDWKPAARDNV